MGLPMSFKEYLKARKNFDTPAGNFTRGAMNDAHLPDASTWAELKAYIEGVPGMKGSMPAAYEVWMSYQKSQRKIVKRNVGRPAKGTKHPAD
jgi:hypothetical protein